MKYIITNECFVKWRLDVDGHRSEDFAAKWHAITLMARHTIASNTAAAALVSKAKSGKGDEALACAKQQLSQLGVELDNSIEMALNESASD